MINPADAIRDGLLRHEIGIRRLSNGTVRKVIAALNDSIPDLERQIRQRLGWIAVRGYDASPHTLKRLEANLRELKGVLNEAYKVGFSEAKKDLTGLAKYEGEFTAKMLGSEVAKATGAQVGFGAPSVDLMKAIVETKPFQGRLLRDWAKDLPRDTFTAVRKAVRDGLMQNESIDKIVRRIKGTRALGYSDGVLNQSRRQIENVVRTATAHVTNFARDETYRANSEFIEGVQWTATLDSRTCEICAPRDGLRYDLDHRPIGHLVPWGNGPGRLHINDRCTSTPILKTFKKLGIDLPEIQMPGRRVRGQGIVPSSTTYADWIKGQPANVQNNILGINRAQAMRSGKLKFDSMFDDRGRWLNLDQLRAEDAA